MGNTRNGGLLNWKETLALLAIYRMAYYAGLRIGEVCRLTWQDINLDEQYLTVRRSMRYNGTRHKHGGSQHDKTAVKSVPLISATHWQTSYGKQRRNSIKTVSAMANCII